MESESESKSSFIPWFVGIVALAAISSSFGCGDTATSSDTTDTSFVASPADPSTTLGVQASASSFGEGRPGRRRGEGPPEEALAACADTRVGEPCSFTGREGDSLSGTCSAMPDDSSHVVCRPDDWPGRDRRDRRGPPEEALAACAAPKFGEGDECFFEASFGSVSGSCRTSRNGDALVCFPSDWPRR